MRRKTATASVKAPDPIRDVIGIALTGVDGLSSLPAKCRENRIR